MSGSWATWWASVNGPTLLRVPSSQSQSTDYEQNALEAVPNLFIEAGKILIGIFKWTCLFWAPWIARSMSVTPQLFPRYTKYAGYGSLLYAIALAIRGTGRLLNPTYRIFISLFKTAEKFDKNESNMEQLTNYTFTSTWPAEFDVRELPSDYLKSLEVIPARPSGIPLIFWPFTWLMVNTVGVCLAYPGCLSFMNSVTFNSRMESRDRLKVQFGIRRTGVRTRHGEFVEILYTDRRGAAQSPRESASAGHGDSKGEILILCCEGNSGYPEIGTPLIPLQQGYSVIAWNHPGFGSSTGLPLPHNEQGAVEAALLFAVHHLHFRLDQIVLFGWSVGGYTVTWAAMNYPEVAGIILDATFDNIDELAKRALPLALYPIVLAAIRNHMDLNNMAQLVRYDGPVRIIRRGDDEIITTSDPPSRETNRGNFLLVGLLKYRFPHLMTEENEDAVQHFLTLDAREQEAVLQDFDLKHFGSLVIRQLNAEALGRQNPAENALTTPAVHMPTTNLFPSEVGSQVADSYTKRGMLFYLISEHFVEYPSTHCTPLPNEYFRFPWSPFNSPLGFISPLATSADSVDLDASTNGDYDVQVANNDVVVIHRSDSP